MIYSLSEIDAQCKKAARGAGFDWGHAEETGKSARWLAAMQLPGAALLAEYLPQFLEHPERFQTPLFRADSISDVANEPVHPNLCPIKTAACLCDEADILSPQPLSLGKVVYPLLLLPAVAMISQHSGLILDLSWDGFRVVCRRDGIEILIRNRLDASEASDVTLQVLTDEEIIEQGFELGTLGQDVSEGCWEILADLAHKTYVPATEESRRGAGPAD